MTPGFKEIVVPENATGTALHEDRVLVRRDVRPKGLRPEAAPSRPPARSSAFWNGGGRRSSARCNAAGSFSTSFRMTRACRTTFTCPNRRDVGRPARVGDKVVVELREWESRHTNPEGEIIEVLGAPDEEGVDMLSVLRQYNLPLHFPKDVLHEAHAHRQ